MMQTLYLSFTLPDGVHKKIELKPDPADSVLIGRNRASHIKLNLPSVSRQHAKIFYESGNYWIEDLGSSNGTFVNREQVHHVRISPGDLVQCGEFEIEVLSHAETSVYGVEEAIEELKEVEVLSEPSLPPSNVPALEPRPRPQTPRLSVPPPRAMSPFSTNGASLSTRPAVHSKAPTNQPQDRPQTLSTRPSVQPKRSSTVVDSGAPVSLPPMGSDPVTQTSQLEKKLKRQSEELSNTQAQADAQRALADKLKAEVQELNSERQQARLELKSAHEERDHLKAELEEARAELKAMSTQGQSTDSEVNELKEQLQSTAQARDELKEQLKTLGAELQQTQETLEQVRSSAPSEDELSQQRAEVAKLRAELQSAEALHHEQQRSATEEQDQLRDQLRQAQNQQGALRDAEREWAQEREGLAMAIEELKEQLAEKELALRAPTPTVSAQVTSADWAAHLARFEQLEHELKALRRAVKGQAVGGVRPNTRPPAPRAGEPPQEQRSSIPPREQPREWRGLV